VPRFIPVSHHAALLSLSIHRSRHSASRGKNQTTLKTVETLNMTIVETRRFYCSAESCQLRSIRCDAWTERLWEARLRDWNEIVSEATYQVTYVSEHLLTSHNASRGSHVTWRHRPAVNYRYSMLWDWLASSTDNEQSECVKCTASVADLGHFSRSRHSRWLWCLRKITSWTTSTRIWRD